MPAHRNNSASTPGTESLARRSLLVSSIAIGCLALALFIWYSLHVLLLIFAGVLVALILRGLAGLVSTATKLNHKWSLAIVLLVLTLFFAGVGWLAVPTLLNQVGQLGDRIPQATNMLKEHLQSTPLGNVVVSHLPTSDALAAWRDQTIGNIGTLISGAIGAIVTVMVVAAIGIYVAAEPELYLRGLLWLVPDKHRNHFAEILGSVGFTLKWWLIGQAVDMLVIGALMTVGMWMVGVPLALLLGFLAAIFNFIPNFGPLFALIPAMLLALTISPAKVVWVVAINLTLQAIEGYLLLPLIQRRAIDLPGALIISTQVLLGLLAGGLGLALATPLTAAAFVAIKMLYVEDTLGEVIDEPSHDEAREEIQKVKQAKRQIDQAN